MLKEDSGRQFLRADRYASNLYHLVQKYVKGAMQLLLHSSLTGRKCPYLQLVMYFITVLNVVPDSKDHLLYLSSYHQQMHLFITHTKC
jgi:hypothetical protein